MWTLNCKTSFCDGTELKDSWEKTPMPESFLTFFASFFNIKKVQNVKNRDDRNDR